MWSDIVLQRDPDGSIPEAIRGNLAGRSDAEARAAVAYVEAHEDRIAAIGGDRSRDDEARDAFREAQRVRELLRIRAYTAETARIWTTLPSPEQELLLGRAELAGLGRDRGVALAAIGTILNQLVVARLVSLATETKGAEASVGEAMIGLPIAFQLEVIRETGADLRVPGELLRTLAGAAASSA